MAGVGPAKRTILVAGCGAIGGLYAARLAAVAEVLAYDADRAQVAAIRREGLRVTGRTAAQARIEAFDDPAALEGREVHALLFLVKSQATVAAWAALAPRLAGRPLLVTLQNGLGNAEALAASGSHAVAEGFSSEAARSAGHGVIEHFIHGEESWLGPLRGSLAEVQWFGALLDAAGLPTRVVADARPGIWAKFLFNCVMNPVGALLAGENRARYEVAEVRELIDRLFAEGLAVARAEGIEPAFDPMHIVKKIRAGELPLTRHAGSMATDIAAGRATELEAMTGVLLARARAHGVPTPALDTVYRLAKGLEYAAGLRVAAARRADENTGSIPQREGA